MPKGLRLRLTAEAPGAVLDDHTRWRSPLVTAADRLRIFGLSLAWPDRSRDGRDGDAGRDGGPFGERRR